MLKRTGIIMIAVLLICLCGVKPAAASDSTLSDYIEQTIENDKETLSNLSPALEKLYEAAIKAFKSVGTLSKEISKVVSLYNALDESDQDYEKKLEEFFREYNALSPFKRKVVDAITGVLGMKDKLQDSLKHSIVLDKYSTKPLECELEGKLQYLVDNETIATVKDGVIVPVDIGYTSITVSNDSGEEMIYRVIVKKPVLASTVSVMYKKTVKIALPSDTIVNEVSLSSKKKISYSLEGNELSVTGLKKGSTAYVYVGTKTGKTLKYKIKVTK
ncbi:MAG: hypothetical protein J5824_01635 [Lachnospiraceae bacterium]|nr:hypothetical protein [Lachnospiraceae bacterium]